MEIRLYVDYISSMIRKILLTIFAILLVALIAATLFVYVQIKPGGDIDAFSQYEVNDTGAPSDSQVKVTFFGVSTLLLDDGETQILIDGFFSRPPVLQALFKEVESDTVVIDQIVTDYHMDRVKGVFVTHSHYDHGFDVAYVTRRTGATLYGSLSTLNIGRGGNVPENQLELYQPYEDIQIGKFSIRVIPTIHSPDNALKDDGVLIEAPLSQPAKIEAYSEGGSFDFYIQHNGHTIFIKPSPNYEEGVLDTLQADVVMLGIATVVQRGDEWKENYYQYTIGVLNPETVIPLHWDNFLKPVSNHLEMLPRFGNKKGNEDFEFFISRTQADGIDFKILQGMGSVILF
ncbi:MAG: MBL fold metallo-hydrolase [Bacteroidia bacterium]